MLQVILIAAAGALTLSAAHAAVDVRHSEGVEMITGRQPVTVPSLARTPDPTPGGPSKTARANAPSSPSVSARTGAQMSNAADVEPPRSQPKKVNTEDERLAGRLPIRDNVSIQPDAKEDASGDGMPKDGATPVRKRLHMTEAVLQDQIAAYNRALLEETPPEKLAPLEEAISRTLDQIDVLVRNTRAPKP